MYYQAFDRNTRKGVFKIVSIGNKFLRVKEIIGNSIPKLLLVIAYWLQLFFFSLRGLDILFECSCRDPESYIFPNRRDYLNSWLFVEVK